MTKGPYATPSINPILYGRIQKQVNERKTKGLPTYTAPDIVNRLMLYFLQETTEKPDPELAAIAKEFKKIENAFDNLPSKFFQRN